MMTMQRRVFAALSALFLTLTTTATITFVSAQDHASTIAQANNQFTTDFYTILTQKASDKSNLIFSPFSLSTCVAMLKAGAGGETAREIQAGMHYPDDDLLFQGYERLLGGLKSNENYTLETANSIYTKAGFTLSPNYKQIVQGSLRANIQQLDFANGKGSADIINGFVEKVTDNRIKDLVNGDDLNEDTRLVLVNAIYFKGKWKNQFDKKDTHKEKFHASSTNDVEVDMMKITSDFDYGELKELDAKVVRLPYTGDRLSMIIILPNKEDGGLSELETKLKTFDLSALQSKLWSRKVTLLMPKFKLESEIDLKAPLEELGMKSMFDMDKSDLSRIPADLNAEPLFVSKAVQKAFLEVNEEGSEAAAATAAIASARSGLVAYPEDMTLNRPFFAFIQSEQVTRDSFVYPSVQNPSPVILFFSTVTDPSSEKPFQLKQSSSSAAAGRPTTTALFSSYHLLLLLLPIIVRF